MTGSGPSGRSAEYFQVNAFSDRLHGGNPGGVVIHDGLPEATMQALARDLFPSVTAFIHDQPGDRLDLRWFTRMGDEVVTFCGHATFAAAHVMLRHKRPEAKRLAFSTISGVREVGTAGEAIVMSAPAWACEERPCPPLVEAALGLRPQRFLAGARDVLLVYDEADLPGLKPDFAMLLDLGCVGVIATGRTGPASAAFRFFCPGFDIGEDEDSATGSAQSTLAPFWARELGVTQLETTQLSQRGGRFDCTVSADAVTINAPCRTFVTGSVFLPD